MYEVTEADCVSTESVARWIAQYDFDKSPENVKEAVNLVLLDTLGVMLASTRYNVGKSIIRGGMALSTKGNVLVPGTSVWLDITSGALVCGTLGHGLELDEVHLPSLQHVAAPVVPAALALGQHLDSTLAQLRRAILIGYEVSGHLGIAIDYDRLSKRSFHPTAVVSGFGCAAVAARLIGLTAEETYHALGLAASQASGTLAWHTESHHMSKSFQIGITARNGVTAALLAHHGYQGPLAVFAGPCNVCKAFSGVDPGPEWFRRLGKSFEILNSSKKLYAAGRPMHAALDALFAIMKRESIRADEIESMEICMPHGAARIVDGNHTGSIDCRTVMATAAIDGKIGVDHAEESLRMSQPDVQALKQRIQLVHDSSLDQYFPHNWPAVVRIRCHDGRDAREKVVAATGDRERPVSADALKEKFCSLAEPVLGRAAVEQVMRLVLAIDVAKVRDLARLLAVEHEIPKMVAS
jgi:2-methylcitrate dehydratase PrpD